MGSGIDSGDRASRSGGAEIEMMITVSDRLRQITTPMTSKRVLSATPSAESNAHSGSGWQGVLRQESC